jgi:ATP-binding cassette subfamily B protein
LREVIGFVPQKNFLFSGTVAENLRMGFSGATPEAMEDALKIAQAYDFVSKLENGLDTHLSQGGSNLSGGQKQRLAIARALVRKPKLYIFDDSFSALDLKTDAQLRAALKTELETTNAAAIVVAQRITSVMDAEQIIVLEDGAIAGIGAHSELLKTCAVYSEIVRSQLSEEEMSA